MRVLSAMGLAALVGASATASPTQHTRVVVGKMQELNLEQVCAPTPDYVCLECLIFHSLSRLTLPPAGRST